MPLTACLRHELSITSLYPIGWCIRIIVKGGERAKKAWCKAHNNTASSPDKKNAWNFKSQALGFQDTKDTVLYVRKKDDPRKMENADLLNELSSCPFFGEHCHTPYGVLGDIWLKQNPNTLLVVTRYIVVSRYIQ